MGDLCNQIQSEEAVEREKIEEINSSDNNITCPEGSLKGSESEDDPLLQQIHGKILGVLTYDTQPVISNKVTKSMQIKESSLKESGLTDKKKKQS